MKSRFLNRLITVIFILSLGPVARAHVIVTKLEPPLSVGVPWAFVSDLKGIDFNHDGQTNLFLNWDMMFMSASFFAPDRVFIRRDPPAFPGATNISGVVGALPFGTVIGSNMTSSANLTNYIWHSGDLIPPGESTDFGDRGSAVGYVADGHVIGQPPIVAGDVVGREGVMAFEVFVNGEPHFAYVHFDFRPQHGWGGFGFGGVVYGWAYETEPGSSITAQRLNNPETIEDCRIVSFVQLTGGGFFLTCATVAGGTYRVESGTDLVTWENATADVTADTAFLNFTIAASSGPNLQRFFRIHRVN